MANRPRRQQQAEKREYVRIEEVDQPRSYVFYGRSGTGKTTLASTFPKPLLHLDVRDRGTDSIADIADIYVEEIEHTDDFEDIYWDLKYDKFFKGVVVDTVTMLQTCRIEEVIDTGGKRKKRNSNSRPGDWGTMTKQEWGSVSSWMKTWITNYRDLPMDVIFLAQERLFSVTLDEEEEEIGVIDPEVGPALMPSVKGHLNAAVNVIGNTFLREKEVSYIDAKTGKKRRKRKMEYCLGLGPSALFTRKIRKPKSIVLPELIVDPEYEDIIEIIKGEW